MLTFLKPFSTELWLMILFAVVTAGTVTQVNQATAIFLTQRVLLEVSYFLEADFASLDGSGGPAHK